MPVPNKLLITRVSLPALSRLCNKFLNAGQETVLTYNVFVGLILLNMYLFNY